LTAPELVSLSAVRRAVGFDVDWLKSTLALVARSGTDLVCAVEICGSCRRAGAE
jgi:hypothetical protein